jgi:serine/threonine protein kinase
MKRADIDQQLNIFRGSGCDWADSVEQPTIHREVKPENVLIDRHGRPKPCDFGFVFPSDASHIVYGSLPFMAPELLNSTEPADPFAVDVWALGITFYFMAVGRLSWNAEKPQELMLEVARRIFKIPQEHFGIIIGKMFRTTHPSA